MISPSTTLGKTGGRVAIQKAKPEHVPEILRISSEFAISDHSHSLNPRGVLAALLSAEDIKRLIKAETVLVALGSDSEVLGYSVSYRCDSPVFTELLDSVWNAIRWVEGFQVPELVEIGYFDHLVASRKGQSMGAGTRLYLATVQSLPPLVAAAVLESPVDNRRVSHMLTRRGFQRVGEFSAESFRGIDQFSVGIYLKDFSETSHPMRHHQ